MTGKNVPQLREAPKPRLGVNGVLSLQCAVCGFYQKTTNLNIANLIVPKHAAGWGSTHVVTVS